jgi:hypothetical protein
MKASWHTAWHGQDIVVYRDDAEVDRLHARQIERVVFVHRDSGDSPGDLVHAVVVMPDDCLIFAADTGFAGRVNFERLAFWAERACVYWVGRAQAALPPRLHRGRWFLRSSAPMVMRVPRSELGPVIDGWPLEGPQTWEQRKWHRIENNRPFAAASESARLRA